MKKVVSFLIIFAMMLPLQNLQAYSQKKLIAKVDIEDAAPEGATALLYKLNKGCLIEYTEFYETGKHQYNYVFNHIGLISASQIRFDYANGGLSNPNNKSIKIAQQEKIYLNVKNQYIVAELNRLKHEFNLKQVSICQ